MIFNRKYMRIVDGWHSLHAKCQSAIRTWCISLHGEVSTSKSSAGKYYYNSHIDHKNKSSVNNT